MTTITTENTIALATTTVVAITRQQLRETLSAHLLSTGRDELLPVFCHVHLWMDGTTLVAESSDRYRLTITRMETDVEANFDVFLHWRDAQRIVKAIPVKEDRSRPADLFLSVAGTTLKIDMHDSTLAVVVNTDLDWPRISNIGNSFKIAETERIGFNPAYLIDFAKMPRERNTPAVLELSGSGRPTRSDWTCHDVSYRHVLMSMRIAD